MMNLNNNLNISHDNDCSNTSTATTNSNNRNTSAAESNNNSIVQTSSNNNNSSNNNSSDQSKPKRNPYCSRCRNHGKIAQVKGHKRHCEYRDCQCEGCKLVECRQIVSAAQIKRRRYQKQDEECGRRIEISPPVLTRDLNCPASLIAKHVGLHHPHPHQQIHHQHHHHQHQHYQHQQQQQRNKHILAAAAAAANPLFQIPSIPMLSAAAHATIPAPYGVAAAATAMHLGGQQPQPQAQPQLQMQVQSARSQSQSQSQSATSAAAAAVAALVSVPSPQDQLNLVIQLDRSFGPLVSYAWLKAEQFDFKKIRDTIEMSKIHFEELLQATSQMDFEQHTHKHIF